MWNRKKHTKLIDLWEKAGQKVYFYFISFGRLLTVWPRESNNKPQRPDQPLVERWWFIRFYVEGVTRLKNKTPIPQATEKKKKETNHLRLTAERSRGWINRGLFLVSFYFPWKWPGEKKCKRPPKNHAINRLTPKGRPWRLTDYYIAWEFFGGHHFFYFISRGGSFIFPSKIYPSPLIVD